MTSRGDADDSPDRLVRCPEPGCEMGYMLHPIKVEVNRGGELTVLTSEGTRIEGGHKPDGRGVSNKVFFEGECGHVSMLKLHFHKGSTIRHFKSLGSFLSGDDEDPRVAETIWRD